MNPYHLKRIGISLLLLLVITACSEKQVEEVPKHELTEQEQKKQHLDESFSAFASMLNLEETADIKEYIVRHSVVSIGLDRSLIYDLRQDGLSLLWLKFRHLELDDWLVDGDLYGGIEVHGSLQPLNMLTDGPEKWDQYWDIHVFDNGEDVATLGLEVYDLGYIPVFRFPDGTSYSITTVLLIEPLIHFLLEHVLSTE
jgi:hypothetical protein